MMTEVSAVRSQDKSKPCFRVVQIVASTRADHGGTSRCVPALCDALASCGVDVHLVTGRSRSAKLILPSDRVETHFVNESNYIGRVLTGRSFAEHLKRLHENWLGRCIFHDNGIWMPSNHAVASSARRNAWARVVSTHGMVSNWALKNGSIQKRLAWLAYQKRDLDTTTAFHATSDQEVEELRLLGLKQPIAVIPNGVELPASIPKRSREGGKKRVLFLSRLHPKKGLLNLVSAWKNAGVSEDWELLLVGPDEAGHKAEIQNRVSECSLESSIQFFGEVNDVEKWQHLADADLFVLPSFSENFGIVVAEALIAGLPVVASTGTPWQRLAEDGVGWWVKPTVEDFSAALRTACRMTTAERLAMSRRAVAWAATRFEWSGIAIQTIEFYRWLLEGGARPDFVRVW